LNGTITLAQKAARRKASRIREHYKKMAAWSLPPELRMPTPRAVRMSPSFGRMLLLIVLSFATMAGYSEVVGVTEAVRVETLRQRGISITAAVIRLSFSHGRNGYRYYADYQFQPTASTTISASGTVSRDQYAALRVGSELPIVYDPLDIQLSRINFSNTIQRSSLTSNLIRSGLPALIVIATGGFFIGIALVYYHRAKNLLEWGTATQATIEKEEYSSRNGSKLTYAFYDNNGQKVHGTMRGVPADTDSRPESIQRRLIIFQNRTVLFDPIKSTKNTLYPSTYVEVLTKARQVHEFADHQINRGVSGTGYSEHGIVDARHHSHIPDISQNQD
jgi:hypothetical protein